MELYLNVKKPRRFQKMFESSFDVYLKKKIKFSLGYKKRLTVNVALKSSCCHPAKPSVVPEREGRLF